MLHGPTYGVMVRFRSGADFPSILDTTVERYKTFVSKLPGLVSAMYIHTDADEYFGIFAFDSEANAESARNITQERLPYTFVEKADVVSSQQINGGFDH